MLPFIYSEGMNILYIVTGISVILLFLQMIRKVSLSHPALAYPRIVLFPIWCAFSFFNVLARFGDVIGSYETVPGESLLSIFGKYSGSAVIKLVLVFVLSGIPYLLFLVGYLKINLFPYKSIRKCTPAEKDAIAPINCTWLCRYALFMVVVYLLISIYVLVLSFEPLIMEISMLTTALPWGIAGTILVIIVVPPLGLLVCLVVAGLSAFMLSMILAPLLFIALLLTIAFILTLNAVIRTCRFTKKKTLWLAILSIFPGVNIGILIYLLNRLSCKKSSISYT